jgi:hypothetical protein
MPNMTCFACGSPEVFEDELCHRCWKAADEEYTDTMFDEIISSSLADLRSPEGGEGSDG